MAERPIIIDENYSIEEDVCPWNLVCVKPTINAKTGKQGVDKHGNPTYATVRSYHPNLRLALVEYLEQSQRGSKGVQQAVDAMLAAEQRVMEIFK